jgi:hypothetical protein
VDVSAELAEREHVETLVTTAVSVVLRRGDGRSGRPAASLASKPAAAVPRIPDA